MGCNKSDGAHLVGQDPRVQGERGVLGAPPDSLVTAILGTHTHKFEDILNAVQSIKATLEPKIDALHIDVGHLREEHKKLKERVTSAEGTISELCSSLETATNHIKDLQKEVLHLRQRLEDQEGRSWRCWFAFTRKSGQEFPYAPQLLLRVVPGGAVSLHEPSLRAWEVAGIVEGGDLFEDHMLVPFDNLVNDFSVSPGTFMAYVAVTRQAAVRWDTLPRELDTSILLQTLLTHGGERKAITHIYKWRLDAP
ncbi:hypothetical protein NDU88_004346 [Pleurodeles waltl]|uniref:Uncharacterized protein n=1 Tax=Pleurodeles waltl TaxID=8319 RepID=A0AAV7QBP2_PLEWA|nr:hypothetical protein NDU88_004346 [Pleurodeles waltl]